MVTVQYSDQHQRRAQTLAACVWLPSGSASSGWQSCSLAKQGRNSSLPLLPVSCHVYLNIGPQQKNCPPLCVCIAPIASAITGIKVKESRYLIQITMVGKEKLF